MIDHIEYNSERTKLIIPEYGRHIQKMVDFAISRETKEERNKVANSILCDLSKFLDKMWFSNLQGELICEVI